MELSDEQQAFLGHPPTESARLLAGPGTGKSFTSVAYLERVVNDNPKLRVGYITFTRAATAEFAKKLADSEYEALRGREPKTMHGYSLGVLLKHHSSRIPYPLRIPDTFEAEKLIRPDISRRLRGKGFADVTPTDVKKLEGELAATFESLSGAPLPMAAEDAELVNAFVGVWQDHRTVYGYTLLSELPMQAGGVLEDLDEADPGVDLLIVDEYQDLNAADQRVLKVLAERGVAVIAIGDDDQSIYSWREAAPDGIRRFGETFSTTYDYPLSISQRCGGYALDVANSLIEQDPKRPKKKRVTPAGRAPNTDLHYLRFNTDVQEAKGIAKIVASRIAAGVAPSDIAILVRSSLPAWSRALGPALVAAGVEIAPGVDVKAALSDPGVRTSLAVGQLSQNLHDSLAWRALMMVTPGIGEKTVDYVFASETTGGFAERLLELHAAGYPALKTSGPLSGLVNTIRPLVEAASVAELQGEDETWATWLSRTVGEDRFDAVALNLFHAVGEQYGIGESLTRFTNEFDPSLRDLTTQAGEGVRIMTMAASKGLTVNTALIVGAEAGNIPSPRGIVSEELRLLYVALTRATHLTVVTYTNRRVGQTARIGAAQVGGQREQSPFMTAIRGLRPEAGAAFADTL